MRCLAILFSVVSTLAGAAVTIDRVAVIVGRHVIKLSDIDRDVRMIAFLNRTSSAETAEAKRTSAARLVDQQLIRNEMATGGYSRASDADADAMLKQIVKERFGGSEDLLKRSMAQYGLSHEQVQAGLLWQLTVLRFIEQRFRSGVLVTDEQVQTYYDQHSELHAAGFEKSAPQIRATLEGVQVNKEFEAWLDDARKSERIEYRDEAFK